MELFKLAGALLSQPRFILACFRLHEVRLLLGLLIQFASAAYVAWDVSQFGVRPQAFMIAAAALVFAWLYVSPPRLSLSSCAKECLSGRIAVVTGGNAGLGLHLSLGLAARGATVVIACRNAVSGAAVVDAIRKA